MLTIEELREMSDAGAMVLGAIMEGHYAVDEWKRTELPAYAERLVDALYAIENDFKAYEKLLTGELREFCAAVYDAPVKVFDEEYASFHDAIWYQAANIGNVAYAIVKSALPDFYQPGVKYLMPPLVAKPDMMANIPAAASEFSAVFASVEELNSAQTKREQEIGRAVFKLRSLGVSGLTSDELRKKYCFDAWQRGDTLKEINTALANNPHWESYENDKSVRGLIEAWAKRINIKPRDGQPGRPKKKHQ